MPGDRRNARNQETWEAIAERLWVEYGIKISFQSVQSFFKRATDPEHKPPLDFEPETPRNAPIQRLKPVDPSPVTATFEVLPNASREASDMLSAFLLSGVAVFKIFQHHSSFFSEPFITFQDD